MLAEQKNTAARFIQKADSFLSGAYTAQDITFNFVDDPEPAHSTKVINNAAQDIKQPVGLQYEQTADLNSDASNSEKLKLIADQISVCNACPLCTTRIKTVSGEGVPHPLVLFIGEGPGADEDESGRPFVGRAGQLLDKMLSVIGLSRQKNCFIANIIKCRPPGNRDPLPIETASCSTFLQRQIDVLKPLLIVGLGRVPLATLLQNTAGITKMRGIWLEYSGIPFLPTFHPSYLLRDESQKKFSWEDFKSLSRRLALLDGVYATQSAELRRKHNI
ncbi:MAG: uracil-DNA glycosylase [Termitinemataceae bacterium]|nr:MAG: uracil-DNA glycosylase [Termitinemataceae bacterium]